MKYFLIGIIGFFFQTASAKNYYVNSDLGKEENNGLSILAPFQGISQLKNVNILPGDSILFMRGTGYDGFFTADWSGSPRNPVVLAGYGKGENPVFSNPGESYILGINGNHTEVNGLDFKNAHSAGILIKGTHNAVKKCTITNTGIGISLQGKHSKIFYNTIYHLHMVKNTEGGDDDYGAMGILVGTGNQEIAFNRIDDCIDKSFDYGVDGGGFEFYGDADSVSIHHNYISNSDGVFEFGAGLISNIRFFYNVFVNNGELGGFHFQGKFSAKIQNVVVANNTVVDTVENQFQMVWFNGTGQEEQFTLVNNILYFGGVQRFCNAGNFIHSNNLYYSPSSSPLGYSLNSDEFQEKPEFKNLAEGDFHLTKKSPAIDKGEKLGFTFDFDNNTVKGLPDLGAFEY